MSAHTRSCRPMRRGRSRVGRSGLSPRPPGEFFASAGYRLQFWPRGVGWTACPSPHGRASWISPPAIRAARDASARRGGTVRGCPATHPVGLGVLNARDTPCPKPAECPAVRRCAGPAPSPPCDRLGARRVGRAVQGGRAGRCWAPRVVEALSQRRARAAQAAHAPGAAAPPMALRHEPAGDDERSARPSASVEPVATGTGPQRRPRRSDGTTRPRGRSRRPRARAVGIFAGGDKTSMKAECRSRQKTALGGLSTSETLAWARQNPAPDPLVTLGLRVRDAPRGVGWIPPLAEGRPERHTTAPRSVQSPPQGPQNRYQDSA